MNIYFNKALYLLDKGKYEEGEKMLNKAIETCNERYEMIQIKACYAELLYEMDKIEEAKECIYYVLDNTSQEECLFERETVSEILNEIIGEE